MTSVTIRVDGVGELVIDLKSVINELNDLKVMQDIADRGARLAAGFAPVRNGALAASVRGSKSKNKAVVTAGARGKTRLYGGPINYGWPDHNIEGSFFMQRADQAMAPTLVPTLDAAITRIIRSRGLG